MIELVSIDSLFYPYLIKWKRDESLAHLIMGKTSENTEEEISQWANKNQLDENQRLWGIYSHELNKPIGIARLMFIDWDASVTELGIYIGEMDAHGKGYGKKALDLLFQEAFQKLNLKKIYLKVLNSNTLAFQLYKKMGFNVEGILKRHHFSQGGLHDIIYMSYFQENYGSR
jgi:RimJ/RimL family protein N-acetyltransferase